MSDIFIYREEARHQRPNHGNNCHGHYTSISAGGNGHSVGDGCGCDELNPTASIEFIIPFLLIIGILLIYKKIKL